MLTAQEKLQRLQDCVALLQDVDVMQQAALGDSDVCEDNHNRLQGLIEDFEADIEELEAIVGDLEDYDGQPDEAQEWHDFDPDC